MLRKLLLSFCLCLLGVSAFAGESWMKLMLNGAKLGYSHVREEDATFEGRSAKKTTSETIMNAGLLGQSMSIKISSSTVSVEGKPKKMLFSVESGGRSQTTEASFAASTIALAIDNNGEKSKKSIDIPIGAAIVDDAIAAIMADSTGTSKDFYVLDPMTATLIKNQVMVKGPSKVEIDGKSVTATLVEISEPRATTQVYLSSKGDFLKAFGPMGLEMIPATEADATKTDSADFDPKLDLAAATSITPNKPIPDPQTLKSLTLRVTGKDLNALPNDAHQSVVMKASGDWTITVHPVKIFSQKPGFEVTNSKYVKPSLNIPSDSTTFRKLAKQVVGDAKGVVPKAKKIHDYVYEMMRPNAGIGVLRDASEILKTKEGVCRDYATLTATILRAAGVPARLCSGLVYAEGKFYYHAWVEAYDGKQWLGVDSTQESGNLTPGHVKLAHGNVEDAFNFTLLDHVRIEVLQVRS